MPHVLPVAREEPQPESSRRAEAHRGTFLQQLPSWDEGKWAGHRPCLPHLLVTWLLAYLFACLLSFTSEMASSDHCTDAKDMIRASFSTPKGMLLMSVTRTISPQGT